jgi:hypothetical protein
LQGKWGYVRGSVERATRFCTASETRQADIAMSDKDLTERELSPIEGEAACPIRTV